MLRLCWRYGLLTALTYILNRGLNDYVGPAAHLLMALLRPSAHGPASDSKAAGYRLLVYLRCCLTGSSFPPGVQAMLILVVFLCQQCCRAILRLSIPSPACCVSCCTCLQSGSAERLCLWLANPA